MRSASFPHRSYRAQISLRSRAVSATLAFGVVALLIALLWRLGLLPATPPEPPRAPNTFQLQPGATSEAEHPRPARRAARAGPKAAAVAPPTPLPTVPTPVPPPRPQPQPQPAPPAMIALDKDQFAAADIGGMRAAQGEGEGDSAGADSVAAYGPGEGPGGAKLYNAEWYREPPPSALALYLPRGPQPGWATIACKTIAAYHVENCRELDETPRGSGLARALRQAAWQFLVRPPRLGGKPLIGAWVRIRFTFTERGSEAH